MVKRDIAAIRFCVRCNLLPKPEMRNKHVPRLFQRFIYSSLIGIFTPARRRTVSHATRRTMTFVQTAIARDDVINGGTLKSEHILSFPLPNLKKCLMGSSHVPRCSSGQTGSSYTGRRSTIKSKEIQVSKGKYNTPN